MSGIRVWSAEQAQFAKVVRRGDGARLCGGRWNSPGRPAIYCAGSLSLAMLEILVHVTTAEDAGVKRVYFEINLAGDGMEEISVTALPRTWRSALDVRPCRALGDAWLSRASAVALKVPSAINPIESNFILNPAHPDFSKLLRWSKAKPFQLDARLLQSLTPILQKP